MAPRRERRDFTVLVATDGSAHAHAALAAAASFPWPAGARARAVLARGTPVATGWSPALEARIEETLEREARRARTLLRSRWPDAEVAVLDGPPVEAILGEARRRRAAAVVVGSRGLGALSRLVLGSVSLGVVRRAGCPVLVVKRRLRQARHLLVGVDGSSGARAAVRLLAGLPGGRGRRVTLVSVVEPVRPVSLGLLPSGARAALSAELRREEAARVGAARQRLEAAARDLGRAGWSARIEARSGVPVAGLLAAVAGHRPDVAVVGARGVTGVERLLLGSVAEGMLTRATVSVLVVR